MIKYPFVECADGHPLEPGYAVCSHALAGRAVSYFELATTERLGVVACDRDGCSGKDLLLTCASCVREKFPELRVRMGN